MADNQVAFLALIDRLTVKMSYGDKEATLTLKFRPEGSSVEDLNRLMGDDQAVMIGIVPMIANSNGIQDNGISERSKRKPKRKAEGDKV